ncbi:class I SAM-dependent methyltransferase [Delftia sp. CH05]|uniref:class I SAM-dependent methyltransferase n=1 Tax=Delftia sp. CH05 TaxID=2692194 RepID=UPI00135EE457|nr:class I SAM-dependent methyltransferase [Delftia sp. CH05]MXN31915.1 methyltransferase domain-containing protein [Delftia sp. CH05]
MQLKNLDKTSTASAWDSKWSTIFDHYQKDLRHAHYMRALMHSDERKILEMAAGSFRDMAALRRAGLDCHGMDFSGESIERAKANFPEFKEKIHQMSAFEMPFDNQFFDVSYHNGFWVLFSDENIRKLAQEQARITGKRMFATVHNAHNRQFVDYFDRLKKDDPLYDVRFFHVEDLTALMSEVCDDVQVIPVGKGKRRHEDWLIKMGITHPLLLRSYLKISGMQYLNSSERLLCVGTPRHAA